MSSPGRRWIVSIVAPRALAPRAALAALIALASLALPARPARPSSTGPNPGLTGAPALGPFPAEPNCTSCHASSPLNPDARGSVRLEGLPERYAPGQRYALAFEVRHPDPDRQRWGFQVTAVAQGSGLGAGELVVTDPADTQRIESSTTQRQYLEHTADGTGMGETGGHRWEFAWVAPASDVGDVAFYGAGNAANLDGSKEGDLIFDPAPEPLAVVHGPGTR